MRRTLVALLLVCAGCGTHESASKPATRPSKPPRCVGLTGFSIIGYEICDGKTIRFAGKALDVPRPVGAGRLAGEWIDGFVSPDAKTLLLQWMAECETPYAFFVPARGGAPRLVTRERTLRGAPTSIADGWTTDGRAIVELPEGACGAGDERPGIYFVARDGKRTFVAPIVRR